MNLLATCMYWLTNLGYLLTNAMLLLIALHGLLVEEKRRLSPPVSPRPGTRQAILAYERQLKELHEEQTRDRLLLLIQRRQLAQLRAQLQKLNIQPDANGSETGARPDPP